jgi:hypothetical protein
MKVTPARGGIPTSGGEGVSARWHVIESALDSWPRTLRLSLLLLVAAIPPSAISLGAWLLSNDDLSDLCNRLIEFIGQMLPS